MKAIHVDEEGEHEYTRLIVQGCTPIRPCCDGQIKNGVVTSIARGRAALSVAWTLILNHIMHGNFERRKRRVLSIK